MNASERGNGMLANGAVAASSTRLPTIANNERLRSKTVGFAVARKGFVVDGVASDKAGTRAGSDRSASLDPNASGRKRILPAAGGGRSFD